MLPTDKPFNASILAGVFLLGKDLICWPGWPTTEQVLELTGSGRSQAYAMASRLKELLTTLAGKPGRPTSGPALDNALLEVGRCIQDYLMRHPGAASIESERYRYSDKFRRFIVGLVAPGQPGEGLSAAQLAEASRIPLGTLKSWLGQTTTMPEPHAEPSPEQSIRQEHWNQICTLYQGWKGNFKAFCRMVRDQYQLDYGATAIGTLLHQTGLRRRKSTSSRTPNRDSYRKLFPGAQWLGDGSTMRVHGISAQWGEITYTFNLEAILDVSSNALLGLSVSDSEDEEAVLSAYQDAIATAGGPPLSLSLDNKPCNHTQGVREATAQTKTTLLPTTPFRPESKAPIEGSFGLFKQSLPEIVVDGDDPREQARKMVELAFLAWSRGRNGKPRRSLGGLSPADYYQGVKPTPEQSAEAKRHIEELQRKQEAIRRTRAERADPIKLEFLKQALLNLNIADPEHKLAIDLAYYPLDSIVDGVGIFQAKRQLQTLPPGVDPGRYLRGIIGNAYEEVEVTVTAERHIQNRLWLRDLSLRRLVEQEEEIRRQHSAPEKLLPAFIDRALAATRTIDYHFWALQCTDTLSQVPIEERSPLYRGAARRIAASYRVDRKAKQSLLSRLARVLLE